MNHDDPVSPQPNSAAEPPQAAPQPAAETTAPEATESAATDAPTSPAAGSRIAIGSQRDTADKSLTPAKPKAVQAAQSNPIQLGREPEVETPVLGEIHSTAGLSDDLDAEIDSVLGSLSMDDIVSSTETQEKELESGTRLQVPVTRIHGDHVFVKIDGQREGVAALHQFTTPPAEGQSVELIVRGRSSDDGLYEMAVPGAAVGSAGWDELNEGDVVQALVTGSNTGGLETTVNQLRGFIPASQIDRFRVSDLEAYVNRKLDCVVVELNPEKRKLVLSHRAVLERQYEEQRKELLKELEAGQVREGVVTKLMDFGAFVDLGGAEGLIHISKLSWSRIKHPSDVVQVGDRVKVKVESVDLESNRISLSHRDTLEDPWENVTDQFHVDQIVRGTVTRIADFGAFVRLAPGVEGLVHISEVAYKRVIRVSNFLAEGQEIDVKILSIDSQGQKISLSHKATLSPPVTGKPKATEDEAADEPARDLAVPQANEPLKGGTDRKSGGESIGLKW